MNPIQEPLHLNTPSVGKLGLGCPRCGCHHLPVVYTRQRHGYILRLRECRHCGKRIRTQERR